MENKICPFYGNTCVEKSCMFFDEEIVCCEFKDLSRFVGECFNDLIKALGDKIDD